MKIVIAIDSFKGSLSSVEAGKAAAEGVRRVFPEAACVVRPLADGGEGTTEALVDGLGGAYRSVRVSGPLGAPVEARYGLIGETAVMEMAAAAGITLVRREELDPLRATTFGVGEMIRDAVAHGARKFIVGIGGSATNDAGRGMLEALTGVDLAGVTFRVACDVTNPLCGPNGASAVFGPQKGATPEMVQVLDARLRAFADAVGDPATTPGDGAAGGLGFAFRKFLGAQLTPGVDLVLSETHLEDDLRDADFVLTGEGRLDGQTAMGKAPIGVARLAKKHGKTVLAFAGCLGANVEAVHANGIDAFFPILRKVVTLDEALDKTTAAANLAASVEQAFRLVRAVRVAD